MPDEYKTFNQIVNKMKDANCLYSSPSLFLAPDVITVN
jgi:hypothetical protein